MVAVLERGLVRARASLAELGAALYAPANLIDTDSLVDWKDDPRQTQDNVVAVLDQAAAGYEDNCAVLELSLN